MGSETLPSASYNSMGSETLPSACYILSDESKYPFTLRVTGIKISFLYINKEERYSRVPRLNPMSRSKVIQTGKNAIVEYLDLDICYSAKGTKGKWRYASSKARLKFTTYPRSYYIQLCGRKSDLSVKRVRVGVMLAVDRFRRYGR